MGQSILSSRYFSATNSAAVPRYLISWAVHEEKPDRYENASASHFLPLGVQQEIVAGKLVSGISEQISNYMREAKSKGDAVSLINVEDAGHFGFLFSKSEVGKLVLQRFVALKSN